MRSETPKTLEERVDCFCVSFIILPSLPLTFRRWEQIVMERYCSFSFNCTREQFRIAKAFSSEIQHTLAKLFFFDFAFITANSMDSLFLEWFAHDPIDQCIELILLWVRLLRSSSLEVKLMYVCVKFCPLFLGVSGDLSLYFFVFVGDFFCLIQ
jgi:hypothetical protein